MRFIPLLLASVAICCDTKKCDELGGTTISLEELNLKWDQRSLICQPGHGLVELPAPMDCCLACGRQRGEQCDEFRPCDMTVGLECHQPDLTTSGVCKPRAGQKCFLQDEIGEINSGESFWQTCDTECICIDGSLGCRKNGARSPETDCDDSTSLLETAPGYRPGDSVREYRPADLEKGIKECTIQTTKWSPCSRTCGWGFSDRLSNHNNDCKMEKQIMLCKLRNCDDDKSLKRGVRGMSSRYRYGQRSRSRRQLPVCKIKNGKVRTSRDAKKALSFSGCRTKKPMQMRFCPHCPGKHCCPDMEPVAENNEKYKGFKVKNIQFICEDGIKFKKKLMVIKRCVCGPQCKPKMALFSRRRFDSY